MSKERTWIRQLLTEISIPRPSSTVVLVRESAGPAEIFMVQRHASSSFGKAYAFPGGVLDEADSNVEEFCSGLDTAEAKRRLGVTTGGLDFYVAAIRELFEETGILLATSDNSIEALKILRERLNNNLISWTEFVSETGTRMLCNELHYFSHWITPVQMNKRYTTRFFVAECPAGQVAHHDERELTNSTWITAADALQAGENGSIKLHYPTQKTLQSLATHNSVGEIVNWARECEESGVESILPVLPGATQ